jgi:hypothetical protein
MRCYDCGRLVPIEEAVRRDVQVGQSLNFSLGSFLGRSWSSVGSGHRFARVDLCRLCNKRRAVEAQDAAEKLKKVLTILGLIALGVVGFCLLSGVLLSLTRK